MLPGEPFDPSPLTQLDRVLMAAFLLSVFVPGTISVSLFDRDEGWYAQVVREMLASGDWLIPHYLGESRYFKPPWLYWCSAVSVSLLGWSEFRLRLPCVLASVATWMIVAKDGRQGSTAARLHGGPPSSAQPASAPTSRANCCWPTAISCCLSSLRCGPGLVVPASPPAPASQVLALTAGSSGPPSAWPCLQKTRPALAVLAPIALARLLLDTPRDLSWPQRVLRLWPGRGWYLAVLIGLPWYAYVAWADWSAFAHGFIGTDVRLTT